jgi:hypothetical protein
MINLKNFDKRLPTHNSDSSTRRVGELVTPWLPESDSRRPPSRRVSDSPTRQVGESTALRLPEKGSFFLTFNIAFSDSPSQGVVDSQTRPVKESATARLAELASCFSITNIFLRIRSQNRNGSKCSVRDQCQTDLRKNLGKSASLPCPFKVVTNEK